MSRLFAIAIVVGHTACLLAPPRPGNTDDDAGTDAPVACTPVGIAAQLSAVGTITVGGDDALIRGGKDGPNAIVMMSMPRPDFDPACATYLVTLSDSAMIVDVLAVTPSGPSTILVLVSSLGNLLEVRELTIRATTLEESPGRLTSTFAPVPVTPVTGPDEDPAFVVRGADGRVWFGGGTSVGISSFPASGTLSISPKSFAAIPPGPNMPYYQAARIDNRASFEIALSSPDNVFPAHFNGTNIDTEAVPAEVCTFPSPEQCDGRVSRQVQTLGPSMWKPVSVSVTRTSGYIEAILDESTIFLSGVRIAPSVRALDVAVDEMNGSTGSLEAFVLWDIGGGARELRAYRNRLQHLFDDSPIPHDADTTAPLQPEHARVVTGRFVPGAPRRVLVLAPSPVLVPDACFLIDTGLLRPC